MKRPRSAAGRTQEVAEALRGIRRMVGTLHASARAVERRTGITNAQLFLLRALKEHEGLSIGGLATMARTQQSTASIIVQRLVRNGLVRRARSSEDARRVLLSLTPRGRGVLRNAPVPATARLLKALNTLSVGELHALVRGLGALELRLGATEEPGMLFEAPVQTRRGNRRRVPPS